MNEDLFLEQFRETKTYLNDDALKLIKDQGYVWVGAVLVHSKTKEIATIKEVLNQAASKKK